MEILLHTEKDLPNAVVEVLKFADGRKKIALYGDLGAGKTTFVQAFCRHFGVRENVTSPTFSIVNEYTYMDATGQEQLVRHIDLYRLKTVQEALEIGIEDYLFDDSWCLIEWPDLMEALLPEEMVSIKFTHEGLNKRKMLLLGTMNDE
ncbi:MAG: tRNA (adenosine(37)-N6)-threonylcarbamoyltransferase complex ATPase subunit type 1 TsaE [Bacteroidota bacterium]